MGKTSDDQRLTFFIHKLCPLQMMTEEDGQLHTNYIYFYFNNTKIPFIYIHDYQNFQSHHPQFILSTCLKYIFLLLPTEMEILTTRLQQRIQWHNWPNHLVRHSDISPIKG